METLADYGTVSYFGVQYIHHRDLSRLVSLGDRGSGATRRDFAFAFVVLLC